MNSILTQHYLSMKWDKQCEATLITSNEDSIMDTLNSAVSEWGYEITHVVPFDSQCILTVVLYLPGRILSGIGKSIENAIYNIIKTNFKANSQVQQTTPPLTNASQVTEKLQNIKNNIAEKQTNDSANVFNDLLSNTPKSLLFGSKEAEEFEKEVGMFSQPKPEEPKEEKQMPTQPTAEMVNPTGQIIPKSAWTPDVGMKLQAWMQKHNVSDKNQMDAWLKKYCGLTYDYFDPKWTDKFIEWTEALREMQTY